MKILAIRLKNLASLAGPVDIDFTAEPLASAGLFAITGPTGAGKSTLLDALCLALFGSVPRLHSVGREAKVPDAEGDIATYDPRNLLRRGSGAGYAEVDFVGVDGQRYRARWDANRARDKAGGKLQQSRQSLYDLDAEQLLASSKQEYKQQIEARLGLNFEQFTRAVMLAQSEFGAFLKADDRERSELLEKLTNTAIYTQLGQRAFARAREAGEAHRALTDRASHTLPLDAEARRALDDDLDQAHRRYKGSQAQERQLQQQHAWLVEQARLQRQIQDTEREQAQAQLSWAALETAREDLQHLEQLAPQRHVFQRRQLIATQLGPLQAQHTALTEQLGALQQRVQPLAEQRAATQAALKQVQQAQAEAAPALREAFTAQHDLNRLHTEAQAAVAACDATQAAVIDLRQQLDALDAQQRLSQQQHDQADAELASSADLAGLDGAWTAYRGQLQQALLVANRLAQGREELPGLQARASQATQQLQATRDGLEHLFRDAGAEPQAVDEQLRLLEGLLQDNRTQQRDVETLSHLYARERNVANALTALAERQRQAQHRRQQLIVEGTEVKAQWQAAEQALLTTRQLLERQRQARSDSVETLRAQLGDDQPCPVCGSADHPYRADSALLQALGSHDQTEEARALAEVEGLNARLGELRTDLAVVNAQLKDGVVQQADLQAQWQPLSTELDAHALWPALAEQPLAQREAWLQHQARRLVQEITRDETRQRQLTQLQREAAQQREQVQAHHDLQQQAQRVLEQQHQSIAADQARLDEALATFDGLIPVSVQQALRDDPATAFLALDQRVSERQRQREQHQDAVDELEQRRQRRSPLAQQLEDRTLRQQEATGRLEAAQAQVQQAQATLATLLGQHASAEAWQRSLEGMLEDTRQQAAQLDEQHQQLHADTVQLTAELNAAVQRQNALADERTQLEQQITHWRAAHPDVDDANLDRLLALDEAAVAQLRERIDDAQRAVEQGRVRLHERQQQLLQHTALPHDDRDDTTVVADLEMLREQLGEQEQQYADLRARQADDQRRQHTQAALAEEIAAAHGEWQRWARLSSLIGSATGDVFRKIAQGYNLDLLLHHANAQLRQLARRYRLKRGGSALGLLVQDTEMGDELRSVHSLSGGETFLVSLALALGLASMASSTLRIESLFIDEGFGSLDPESLQLAMDALDGLQAQGRKVAVISHVHEMHERIPVQIRVRRQGNGLSDVEVSG